MKTPEQIEQKALEFFLKQHPDLVDVPKEKWANIDAWLLDSTIIGVYRAEVFSQNLDDKYK